MKQTRSAAENNKAAPGWIETIAGYELYVSTLVEWIA